MTSVDEHLQGDGKKKWKGVSVSRFATRVYGGRVGPPFPFNPSSERGNGRSRSVLERTVGGSCVAGSGSYTATAVSRWTDSHLVGSGQDYCGEGGPCPRRAAVSLVEAVSAENDVLTNAAAASRDK